MTKFEKLALKIEKDLGLKAENFKRAYVGKHQKSSGAFVWFACLKCGTIGSCYSATELLKKNKLERVSEWDTVLIEIM